MPPEPEVQLPPPPPAPPAPDPELDRLRGEVRKSQQTIEELKRKLTAPPAPAAQPAPSQPSMVELNKQFYQNPVQNAADIARAVVNDAMQNNQSNATLVRVAKDTIRNSSEESKKIFEKWEAEIQTYVDAAGPQFAANVTVWENAFKIIKGQHIDEILEMRGQQPASQVESSRAPAVHIREGGGPAAPSPRPASAPKATELTAEEKQVAKKMGITEDQYRAGKAHYEGQNDMQRDPIGPSSWDKPFSPGAYTPTFSTKELRKAQRAAREARK